MAVMVGMCATVTIALWPEPEILTFDLDADGEEMFVIVPTASDEGVAVAALEEESGAASEGAEEGHSSGVSGSPEPGSTASVDHTEQGSSGSQGGSGSADPGVVASAGGEGGKAAAVPGEGPSKFKGPLFKGLDTTKLGGSDGAVSLSGSGVADAPSSTGMKTSTGGTSGPDMGAAPDLKSTATSQADIFNPGFGGPSAGGVQRRAQKGLTLTDDEAITEMVRKVMLTEIPKMQSCYERRLKQDESLRGRWTLAWTVTADGKVDGARVRGINMTDDEFEDCLVTKLVAWQFQPIRADMQFSKSVVFKPAY